MTAGSRDPTPTLQIRVSVRQELLDHARREAPNECCGLLVGGEGVIERAVRARNLQAGPRRYLIDPVDHFAAIRTARSEGRAVIGGYHSHPASAAIPSETDIAESIGPEFIYVIVSLASLDEDARMRAYRFVDGRVEPLDLAIVP